LIKIPAAEVQVMEALWRNAPMSRDEIIAQVGPPNNWAPGTVKTLITRLLRKKAIGAGQEEGGYVYRPLILRTSYVQSESQGLLDRLFDGEVTPLVAHLAQQKALTPADVKKLEALIARLKASDDD
jgi:predicted transcriptional regulator